MIYTIAISDLKAVSLAMADKDIRYYLNGVLFELDNAKGYRLVATDGHRMHIVCKRKSQAVDSVVMPRDTVCHILKQKVQAFEIEIIPGETRQIKIGTGAGFITVPEVVGKYPDYRRVMPKQLLPQIEPAHYTPEYLADLAKAQKILGTAQQNGYIAQQGTNGGVYVSDEKSFYAVIMPVRHKELPESGEFEKGLVKVQA
jgi:hypothetical protein